jgi:hypothetical protein
MTRPFLGVMAWNDTFSAFQTKLYHNRTKTQFPKFWPIIQLANCSPISDLIAKLSKRQLFPITSRTLTTTFFSTFIHSLEIRHNFSGHDTKTTKNCGNMPSLNQKGHLTTQTKRNKTLLQYIPLHNEEQDQQASALNVDTNFHIEIPVFEDYQ